MFYRFNAKNKVLPILGGSGSEYISLSGKVKNDVMDDLKTRKDSEGHVVVDVQYLNKYGRHRIVDIMATHFKFMEHLTFDCLDKVRGFCIDGDYENLMPENIGYRFEDGKLEVPNKKGFFYIPGFPRRAIDVKGDLISTLSLDELKWYITQPQASKNITGGYFTNRVEINGRAQTLLRHRAMLLVFKPYPDDCDLLQCNHEDGVPGNDELYNLEWTSPSENLDHGYKNNLRSQNKPILARNIFTGEVIEFHSIAEAGRCLDIKDRTINFRLEKSKFSSVCSFGFQFKYLNDERDWLIPEDPELALKKAIQRTGVIVTDVESGEERECRSLEFASAITGISSYRISKYISDKSQTMLSGYKFKSI